MNHLCIFAGASTPANRELLDMARTIGGMLAARGLVLVYGAGGTGLMGAVANGVAGQGGETHGIIPRFLKNLELASHEMTRLTVTDTMHERKQLMYDLSSAFLVLPGGFGTMEEMLEVLTWRQLKIHHKPVYLFSPFGFWDLALSMFAHANESGFIKDIDLGLVRCLDTLDDVADVLDSLVGASRDKGSREDLSLI